MGMEYKDYMDLSLAVAEKSVREGMKVGAVLVADDNRVLCVSWNKELEKSFWAVMLAAKINSLHVTHAAALYVTINTYDEKLKKFDLEKIINQIQIDAIFIGLPDPALTTYIENDPVLNLDIIKRYPDEVQRKMLLQNIPYYKMSSQIISNSPYYSENRISNLVLEELKKRGYRITKEELTLNRGRNELKKYITDRFGMDKAHVDAMVDDVIAAAFNKKYGTYQYSNDTRSLDVEWKMKFQKIFSQTVNRKIEDNVIVDVGVGGGYEAISLFSECENITFVDVAADGLLQVKNNIPSAKIVKASADNLVTVESGCCDVYISLRTYNSSFFDISKAVTEAKRIIRNHGFIIISVANGFLCAERGCIIPGLLIPGTEFVDIYRGMDTTKKIKKEYVHVGFKDIRLYPTDTEIYLLATAA